jgi:glutamine synthetase adenylyltransferase
VFDPPRWRRPAAPARGRPGDTERQMDILREIHHAQLFHLLAQDLAGDLSVEKLADHLSAAGRHHRRRHHQAVWQTIATRHREVPLFAVIAYGKLGGKELGYVSDLDVIFLYDDDDQDAPAQYAKLAQRFITWMTSHLGRHPVRHRHRAAPGRRQRHAGVQRRRSRNTRAVRPGCGNTRR